MKNDGGGGEWSMKYEGEYVVKSCENVFVPSAVVLMLIVSHFWLLAVKSVSKQKSKSKKKIKTKKNYLSPSPNVTACIDSSLMRNWNVKFATILRVWNWWAQRPIEAHFQLKREAESCCKDLPLMWHTISLSLKISMAPAEATSRLTHCKYHI